MRKIGNTKYGARALVEALKTYNEALSLVPEKQKTGDKKISALLLANRSLVLHQLGHDRAALHDIRRSLDAGYPLHSQYKLFLRQASCFSSLGQHQVAERCVERARTAAGQLQGEERDKAITFISQKWTDNKHSGSQSDKQV